MSKTIILRRLKTKDGIYSTIEQLPEYRPTEYRALSSRVTVYTQEALSLDSGRSLGVERREYREVKREHAVLIEMEEV